MISTMKGLRSIPSALKVLSVTTWRQSSSRLILPSKPFSFTCCRCSEAKPSTNHQEQNELERNSLDPFGLEEIVGTAEKSSTLVQGFFRETTERKQAQPQKTESVNSSSKTTVSASSTTGYDSAKQSRLSEYNNWIREREVANQGLKSEGGFTESLRETHFGKIRVDSDNPVKEDAQYDYTVPPPNPTTRRAPRRRDDRIRATQEEPVIERIEAEHSVQMRASDFLKQLRGIPKDSETGEEEPVEEKKRMVIEKVLYPRNVLSMNPENAENFASSKETGEELDSNVVPKQYLIPDYNAITELDMWNVLRQSVIFQNDFLLVINKPYGVPVHSKAVSCRHTIIHFLKKFAEIGKCEEVYPLHRLDKETTGVLLLAKDKKIASIIKDKFAKREITKVYLAVTKLCPQIREASIKIPVGEGKVAGTTKFRSVLRPDLRDYGIKGARRSSAEAITNYKVINSIREAAFLEVEPVTGLKHQIRVHLGLGLGCPVIGDHKYSHREKIAPQRLHPIVLHKLKVKQSKVREIPMHLHCNKIGFTLPKEYTGSTEPMYLHAKIPFFMKYTLRQLGLIR